MVAAVGLGPGSNLSKNNNASHKLFSGFFTALSVLSKVPLQRSPVWFFPEKFRFQVSTQKRTIQRNFHGLLQNFPKNYGIELLRRLMTDLFHTVYNPSFSVSLTFDPP
jgi:hypothetical protein